METVIQLGAGTWHITKFLPDDVWNALSIQILNLPMDVYNDLGHEHRCRYQVIPPRPEFLQNLSEHAKTLVPQISTLTNHRQGELSKNPALVLWRDFRDFFSGWHPDDFTRRPTIQIYVDGEEDQGTSFQTDGKEVTIPFLPNTGYLLDNRLQIVHGMLTPVRNKIRQSIYLIY